MEYIKDDSGNKIPTHVRCILENGKTQSIAMVIALNKAFMNEKNIRIEDPEYDAHLKGIAKVEPKGSLQNALASEQSKEESKDQIKNVENTSEVAEERKAPMIEDKREELKAEPKKAGRKPSKK